jgi:hypothetical protein
MDFTLQEVSRILKNAVPIFQPFGSVIYKLRIQLILRQPSRRLFMNFYLRPSHSFSILPTAYCLLPTAYCLIPPVPAHPRKASAPD